jgi:pimeloyl-ACP methyl ester carboxylesterase
METIDRGQTDVRFRSAELSLAGTFTTPDGAGPFPAALLLPGSGPLDRDGNHRRLRLELSRDLARLLHEAGWASLRYDKRGVGASDGDYLSTGFEDELADAAAALDWLRARPDVSSVVAIGHSGGSIHSVELAVREQPVDGAVLLATSAKTGEETLRWQARQIGEHLVPGLVKALMRLFRTDVLAQQDKAIAKLKATTTDTARIQVAKVNAKWMREFMAYDPVPALRSAHVPLLAITGSKDVQVDPADLAVIADAAPSAKVLEIEDVDHIMRFESGPISNPRKYGKQARKPIDPRVVDAIRAWLDEQSSGPGTEP